jgi:hypothetical protein
MRRAVLCVMLLFVSAGCATAQPAAPLPAPTHPAPVSTTGADFYQALRPGPAALLTRQPKTLAAAFDEATAVVEAEVTAVNPGRLIGDMHTVTVGLDVARVLHGELRPGLPDTRVEFGVSFQPGPVTPLANRMHADVPRGPTVWLIRWQGARSPGYPADLGLYTIVHYNCAVLADGPDGHVFSAIAQEGTPAGCRAEAEGYATLTDLARDAVATR